MTATTDTVPGPLTVPSSPAQGLRRAASMGDLDVMQGLLLDQPSPLPADLYGNGVLRDAAEGDNPLVVRALIDHGEDLDGTGLDGWTATMHAAAMGKLHALRALLVAGADLTRVERGFSQTALHLAADNNQLGALLLLIEAGADLTVRDRNGDTAYDLADQNRYARARKLLGAARSIQERAELVQALSDEDQDGAQDPGSLRAHERRRL